MKGLQENADSRLQQDIHTEGLPPGLLACLPHNHVAAAVGESFPGHGFSRGGHRSRFVCKLMSRSSRTAGGSRAMRVAKIVCKLGNACNRHRPPGRCSRHRPPGRPKQTITHFGITLQPPLPPSPPPPPPLPPPPPPPPPLRQAPGRPAVATAADRPKQLPSWHPLSCSCPVAAAAAPRVLQLPPQPLPPMAPIGEGACVCERVCVRVCVCVCVCVRTCTPAGMDLVCFLLKLIGFV